MKTQRAPEALEHHYRVELALAAQLRAAPPDARGKVYQQVYDELYRAVPDHPQLAVDPAARARSAEGRLRLLRRFAGPGATLLEIGAGDCAFSRLAAPHVSKVIAVDVSEEIVTLDGLPPNVEVRLIDGVHFPLPDASVDVAFSDQLMEHLAPDDALEQLREVRRVLRPDGAYVCITPNRATGPHDISALHDDVARGFHLREYDGDELTALLGQAGFGEVRFYAGGAGWYAPIPGGLQVALERAVSRLPRSARRRLAPSLAAYLLLGLNVVARPSRA